MSKINTIQVVEYQKLKVGENGFKQSHLDALMKFNEKYNNKYFKPIYKGIQFVSYVGVVQIGCLTIEILPKIDKSSNTDQWQGALLHMLKMCKRIQVDNVSETNLKKRYNSILDLYFELYLQEVERLLKQGFVKQYRKNQSNQLALKGKIVFNKNIQKNLVHKERFYCEHQVYDQNHLILQILLKGLRILSIFPSFNQNGRVNRLLLSFEGITDKEINALDFKKLRLTRNTNTYSKALDIAKMLILNYSPSIKTGKDNMLTLLFDMNVLWEEYIYRILSKYSDASYHVSYQNSDRFWNNKSIRPDIVIKNGNETFVIDTKWKIIHDNNPSDSDLKQMFVYNLHWKASKSMLLYPKIDQVDTEYGHYKYKHLSEQNNQCKLGFISVLDKGLIKNGKLLCDEIIDKLNQP